jgi:carboxypeptidase T
MGRASLWGGKTFSASYIKTIVDNLNIYVFPQANPDGRNYSMNTEALWRKNRRTAAPNSNSGTCVGVDLNRNYDFLWDFQNVFALTSGVSCSADPCNHDLYHGPHAFSEPETQNAKWIHDNFPNIGYFIDLHSYGPDMLYIHTRIIKGTYRSTKRSQIGPDHLWVRLHLAEHAGQGSE